VAAAEHVSMLPLKLFRAGTVLRRATALLWMLLVTLA
jgi:hypothetical protein